MDIALIGRKLGHSLSREIHKYLGSYKYELCELEPEELDAFFEKRDFRGLNVTIPYKREAYDRCDELSDAARRIGCVNTVVKRPDGSLYGDNTDYFGFSYMADRARIGFRNRKVLVLGSGGASLTARAVASDRGAAEVVVISRSGEDNYENISRHADADVIVNCTPVGMFPNNGETPVGLDGFPKLAGVLDMIYNPARTRLILDASKRRISNSNGLAMLVAQAAESAKYFRGDENASVDIEEIIGKVSFDQKNVVLIGMPGSGKTTVGKIVASILGRQFIDTDEIIAERAGKPIPQIFAEDGEERFRELESECVADVCRGSGAVVATGGGSVLSAENREAMRENSFVACLERDLSALATDGRPLSQKADLNEMYRERFPYYMQTCDACVKVCGTPEDAAEAVIQKFKEL